MLTENQKKEIYNMLTNLELNWFEAQLIRLIAKADKENLAKLYLCFPEQVNLVYNYQHGEDYK